MTMAIDQAPDYCLPPQSNDFPWYVLQTQSQDERKLCRDLARQLSSGDDERPVGGFFLPIERIVRWRINGAGRSFKSHIVRPVFPGYLFLRGDADARYLAASSPWCIKTIDVKDQTKLDEQIERLKSSLSFPSAPRTFAPGTNCIVVAGPFMGMMGIYNKVTGGGRVELMVDALGSSRPIELPAEMVEAC